MNTSDPHNVEADDWDSHWVRYADAASSNPAQIMRHETAARLLAEDAGNAAEKMRLFDIGSGQGDMVAMLAPKFPGAEFFGAELSESGVAISRRKVPSATFLVANLFEPPTELARFHGWATHAVCSEVLEHVDDPAALLRAARPCLADGARLIVTVPGGPMSAFDKHIGHRQHFDRASITRVLEDAGFRVERTLLTGFPFFNLYRLTVICRGAQLIEDVRACQKSPPKLLARAVMAGYRALFRFNILDSALGWQVVAVARKTQ